MREKCLFFCCALQPNAKYQHWLQVIWVMACIFVCVCWFVEMIFTHMLMPTNNWDSLGLWNYDQTRIENTQRTWMKCVQKRRCIHERRSEHWAYTHMHLKSIRLSPAAKWIYEQKQMVIWKLLLIRVIQKRKKDRYHYQIAHNVCYRSSISFAFAFASSVKTVCNAHCACLQQNAGFKHSRCFFQTSSSTDAFRFPTILLHLPFFPYEWWLPRPK